MPKILVEISSHGFGHLAQCAPVVCALRERVPNLEVLVRSGVDSRVLRSRLGDDIAVAPSPNDFGVVLASPLTVDGAGTLSAYRRLFSRIKPVQDATRQELEQTRPDLILSNAAFLSFGPAQVLGIPAVGLSSLNWADVLEAHSVDLPGSEPVIAAIRSEYAKARTFLKLTPSLDMSWLGNVVETGVIGQRGMRMRSALLHKLGAGSGDRIGVFAFGGDAPAAPNLFGRSQDLHLLGPDAWAGLHGFRSADSIADFVVAKLGYGIVVEAALCGAPLLAFGRPRWPEDLALLSWMQVNGQVVLMDGGVSDLSGAELEIRLRKLERLPAPKATRRGTLELDGAANAADLLANLLVP
jgi:hypothetical protein